MNKGERQFLKTLADSLKDLPLTEIEIELKKSVEIGMITESQRIIVEQDIINMKREQLTIMEKVEEISKQAEELKKLLN